MSQTKSLTLTSSILFPANSTLSETDCIVRVDFLFWAPRAKCVTTMQMIVRRTLTLILAMTGKTTDREFDPDWVKFDVFDGALVSATTVGTNVGTMDGASDGSSDGKIVGYTVGDTDWVLDGMSVGKYDGRFVGEKDGATEGTSVGNTVGSSEGCTDGAEVGTLVVGIVVGDGVGRSVGNGFAATTCVVTSSYVSAPRFLHEHIRFCTTVFAQFILPVNQHEC